MWCVVNQHFCYASGICNHNNPPTFIRWKTDEKHEQSEWRSVKHVNRYSRHANHDSFSDRRSFIEIRSKNIQQYNRKSEWKTECIDVHNEACTHTHARILYVCLFTMYTLCTQRIHLGCLFRCQRAVICVHLLYINFSFLFIYFISFKFVLSLALLFSLAFIPLTLFE